MNLNFTGREITIDNEHCLIVIKQHGLGHLAKYLRQVALAKNRAFIIADEHVYAQHGKTLKTALDSGGILHVIKKVQQGEASKSWEQTRQLLLWLAENNATRDDVVIGFGGGAVGDLAGLTASLYKRGCKLVHLPTTLLAMVDSSIGGKTGVNLGGKNLAGTIYQPRLVLADPTLLSTMSPRAYTEGLGEVAKYAMLDKEFFTALKAMAGQIRNYPETNVVLLEKVISCCINQKLAVVINDPREQKSGGRDFFNYGHTLGHGLEAATTGLFHGEAVAIGMNFAAQLALRLGVADRDVVAAQAELLEELGLPLRYEGKVDPGKVLKAIARDKKNTSPKTRRFILPKRIGKMVIQEVPAEVVAKTVTNFLSQAA